MAGTTVSTRVPQVPVKVQRIIRQLIQTYGPLILVVLSAPGARNDLGATFAAIGWVVVLTSLKLAVNVKAGPDAPWWLVVLDRAGSAAAAVVLASGLTGLVGLLEVDWAEVGGAALLAAATALVMLFYVPPVEPDPAPPLGGDTSEAVEEDDSPQHLL
jgi:hypothetical protein